MGEVTTGGDRCKTGGVTAVDTDITNALENQFGLADRLVDEVALENSVRRFAERGIVLPTFAQLADPSIVDEGLVGDADPQGADPRNLWRVHWYNDLAGNRVAVPLSLIHI